MRKIRIALGAIVLIAVAGAVIFVATFDVNRYRGTIQSELEKRLGRPANLGDMHLRLFPPRFRVQDLAIADDLRFSPDAPFVKARELDVSVKLLPLLHKQIEISSLDLHQPTVNLMKNHAGEWNFASIGHPPEIGNPGAGQPTHSLSKSNQTPVTKTPSEGPASETTHESSSSEQQFSLGELTIKDGQISLPTTKSSTTDPGTIWEEKARQWAAERVNRERKRRKKTIASEP